MSRRKREYDLSGFYPAKLELRAHIFRHEGTQKIQHLIALVKNLLDGEILLTKGCIKIESCHSEAVEVGLVGSMESRWMQECC